MYIVILPAHMSVYLMCILYVRRSKEGVRSLVLKLEMAGS